MNEAGNAQDTVHRLTTACLTRKHEKVQDRLLCRTCKKKA